MQTKNFEIKIKHNDCTKVHYEGKFPINKTHVIREILVTKHRFNNHWINLTNT